VQCFFAAEFIPAEYFHILLYFFNDTCNTENIRRNNKKMQEVKNGEKYPVAYLPHALVSGADKRMCFRE
jgi:hypothetical protein